MQKFKNPRDVNRWLNTQSRNVSVAVALRSAMRVVPLISTAFHNGNENKHSAFRSTIVLPSLRAISLSWVAVNYPTHDEELKKHIPSASSASFAASIEAGSILSATSAAFASSSSVDSVSSIITSTSSTITSAAFAASSSVDSAASYASTLAAYDGLSIDAEFAERGGNVSELINQRLWLEKTPAWFDENWQRLQSLLQSADASDENWQVWINWFNARITGAPANEKLEVACATIKNKLWQQGPKVVNAHLQELIDKHGESLRQKHIFISYNHNNLEKARWIGDCLEKAGYPVFAQYKDMPPGSNFAREMQQGLTQMDRMIAVLSPDYEQSDQCQAEWAAAYNIDPSGKKRLIIPVVIEATDLNALAKQIVYIPAYSMSEIETEHAIWAAIKGESVYAAPLRTAIADAASPAPSINENVQLHAGVNVFFDQSEEQNRLVELLETQQAIIRVLLQTLPQGAPTEFSFPLKEYQAEIASKGVQLSTETLDAMAQIANDVINGPRAMNNWITDGWQKAFKQFEAKHNEIMQKFPHKPLHDQIYEQAEVDEKSASGDALIRPLDELLSAVHLAHKNGLTTDEFLRVVEKRREIAGLLSTVSPETPEDKSGVSSKKRAILQDAGFVDKAIERIEKVAKISSTDAGKALLKTMGEVGKALWKFIPM